MASAKELEESVYYRRTFLNKPRYESIGLVLADVVRRSQADSSRPYLTCDADLTIGDCSRQITLNFWANSTDSLADIANIEYKSQLLRTVINDFLDVVDEQVADVRQFKKDHPRKKKAS